MKTLAMCAICMLFGLCLTADEIKQPYIIQRGEEIIEVHNMPTFTESEPVNNSFVYVDGEYIAPPYIVSVSNLAVLINGVIIQNDEPKVRKRESYMGSIGGMPTGRVGATPENVGRSLDRAAKSYVDGLQGTVTHFANGGILRGSLLYDGDGGALALVEKARKAMQGDEQAKQALIGDMGLQNHQTILHPDWIERLATNTNLETRATAILEAKRERERQEQERREQQNR